MTKGKNFSANNHKGQRKKSDFYETPYTITKHLMDNEPFDLNKTVCEPACGDGAIVKVLEQYFKSPIIHYDIERDFLTVQNEEYDYIVTNPPFSLAYEFIQQSKKLAKEKFAMLLPLSYLHGKRRYDNIYTNTHYGLQTIYVFTRYPMLGEQLRPDGKYNTGMMVYAWYIFTNGYTNPPTIQWLDNNDDVLSKKDREVTHNGAFSVFF